MASMRASETSEQTVHRQQQNTEHMASMRASEISDQTVHRQQQNTEHMASMRASEISEQTVHRREKDRNHKASMRASETSEQVKLVSKLCTDKEKTEAAKQAKRMSDSPRAKPAWLIYLMHAYR